MIVSRHALYTMRTMQALEVLAAGSITPPKLAGQVQVDRQTARRLLHRLWAEGYAVRSSYRGKADRGYAYSASEQLRQLGARLALPAAD